MSGNGSNCRILSGLSGEREYVAVSACSLNDQLQNVESAIERHPEDDICIMQKKRHMGTQPKLFSPQAR